MWNRLKGVATAYFDLLADGSAGLLEGYRTRKLVRLTELGPNTFAVVYAGKAQKRAPPSAPLRFEGKSVSGDGAADFAFACKGADVTIALQSRRFLFKPLELPARAREFLAMVVRSQIDRLTPWPPEACVYGWSEPVQKGEQIEMTVAAAATPAIAGLADKVRMLGAARVQVETADPSGLPVRVMDTGPSKNDRKRIRFFFGAVLMIALWIAIGMSVYASIVGSKRQAKLDDTMQGIADRRAAIDALTHAPEDPTTRARAMLDTLKRDRVPAVLALEEVSRVLPDDTYLLDFRIEANKLRISGFSHDPPSLIGIMEKSPMFQDAHFFAPTTRLAGDPADRFQLEATFKGARVVAP